jgi:hypothetical protein
VEVGEKLPSSIGEIMKRVIFQNSPKKIEVKVGDRVYLISFHPLLEEKCVNIYGLDIALHWNVRSALLKRPRVYPKSRESQIEL